MEQLKIIDFAAAEESPAAPATESTTPESPATTGTDIALVEQIKSANAVQVFSEGGLDPFIKKIKEQVSSEVFDVTTKKGRERIGSVARQIGSAKQRLKERGAELTEDWRNKTTLVNAEIKRMEEEFDKLRDDVLAPREAYEQIEKDRVAAHEKALRDMEFFQEWVSIDFPPAQIQTAIDQSATLYSGRDWQEFKERAEYWQMKNEKDLRDALARRMKKDADDAEAARLKAEEDERIRQAEEKRIADEASAKATKEAEEKAAAAAKEIADQVEADKKKAEAETTRIKKEKDDADEKVRVAEQNRKNALERALSNLKNSRAIPSEFTSAQVEARIAATKQLFETTVWQEFADQAKTAYEEITQFLNGAMVLKLDDERQAEEKRQNEQAEIAAQKVRDDLAAEQKIKDDAEAKRKADFEHRKKFNRETLAAIKLLPTFELVPDAALQELILAIADGKIPHVTIQY